MLKLTFLGPMPVPPMPPTSVDADVDANADADADANADVNADPDAIVPLLETAYVLSLSMVLGERPERRGGHNRPGK